MSSTAVDPYAPIAPQRSMRFLYALNPLAKLAAAAPPMIALVFVRDLATPVAFLVLSYLVLLIGARLTPLSDEQANYIGVPKEGPYKPDSYRY